MLAETPSIDPAALILILVMLVLILASAVAILVFGFVLAPRAGRGSQRALVWWVIIIALEGLYAVAGVASVFTSGFTIFVLVPPAVIAAQVAMFVQARKEARR